MIRKILKISDMPLITSECWTYYKIAIIQTIPNYENWLINHLKLYIDGDGNAIFGEDGAMYPLSYYCDILNIKDGKILEIEKKQIVKYIIDTINANKYVLLDVNFRRFFDPDENAFRLHETLIYGYDLEKEEFITSILSNNTFKEICLSFKEVENAFEDVLDYYNSNIKRLFDRKLWFLGITILSGNQNYNNVNEEFDLLKRLNWELSGNSYKKSSHNDTKESIFYTGISTIKKLYDILTSLLEENIFDATKIKQCCRTCLKIAERQRMILQIVRYYFEKNNIADVSGAVDDLTKCCKMMETNVCLFYKYEYKVDNNILKRITETLLEVIIIEKTALDKCIHIINKRNEM